MSYHGFPQKKSHVEAHANRVRIIGLRGWKKVPHYWISPYSGLRYSESLAIAVEELRGTFRQGFKTRD